MKQRRASLLIVALVYLAFTSALVGVWAQLFPQAFYLHFPGLSVWVAGDGPYNEHFIRDIGGLNLSLSVLTMFALWRRSPELLRAAGLATLIYSIPHLIYHLVHLSMLSTPADRVGSALGLSLSVLAGLALIRPPMKPGGKEVGP